jgi:hypothetical protein
MAGGPAAHARLLAGDLVRSVDGRAIDGADDLIRLLNAERIGRKTARSCAAARSRSGRWCRSSANAHSQWTAGLQARSRSRADLEVRGPMTLDRNAR